MVEYRSAYRAFRADSHWKRKLALGVLISFIPYVGTVWVLGWQMQYQRNVAWGQGGRIPEWSDFKGQVLLGLKAFVAVLPYSLVLSAVTTPVLMAGMGLFVPAAQSDPASAGMAMAAGLAVWFALFTALLIAIMPLTSSVTLRVALYDTFDSGFQLKETWRLMREQKSELLRAWGFSTLNLGISYGAMLILGALVVALARLALSTQSVFAFIVGVIVVPPLGYLALMALSLYLGLGNAHFFGTYGRIAYRLDPVAEPA